MQFVELDVSLNSSKFTGSGSNATTRPFGPTHVREEQCVVADVGANIDDRHTGPNVAATTFHDFGFPSAVHKLRKRFQSIDIR